MLRYTSLTVLCTRCLCISASFWDNFLPLERNKVSEEQSVGSLGDSQVMDYQSSGAPYGLIHNVLGSNRRARKLSHTSSWNKNDVWLEDGNLLVLKGGVLNGDTKSRDSPNISSNSRVKHRFQPSSRVIYKRKPERRSDRGFETRNHLLHAALAQDQSKLWLRLLGLNMECLIC